MNTHIVEQALLIISPVLLAIVEYQTLARLLQLPMPRSSSSHSSGGTPVHNYSRGKGSSRSRSSSSGGESASAVTPSSNGSGSPTLPISTMLGAAVGSGAKHHSVNSSSGHPIFAKVVVWFFTGSDIFCLLFQTAGGALYANPDLMTYARLLLLVGLGAQLVFFSGFIVLTVFVQRSPYFGFRCSGGKNGGKTGGSSSSFRPVFGCIYATTLLLHLRNIFRVAEFAQGHGGEASAHEYYLFVFDFAPVFASILLFTALHFGWWLGPTAPAFVARQQAAAAAAAEHCSVVTGAAAHSNKQQQPAVEADEVLHIHCS